MLSPEKHVIMNEIRQNFDLNICSYIRGMKTLVKATFPKNYIFPGERIDFNISIDNSEMSEECFLWIKHKVRLTSI